MTAAARKTDLQEVPKENESTAVVAGIDFAADAGMGLEGADKASYAIPFLVVLQSNSPQVEAVPDAKAGMFYNTVTGAISDSAVVVPVAFQRRYNAWAPRAAGGGFRGEHKVSDVEAESNPLKWAQKPDHNGTPQMTLPDGSILKDTRNHFLLIVNADGNAQRALLSISSTQIKKSKRWLSLMQAQTVKGPNGKPLAAPTFAFQYKLSTVPEENDKGKWKGLAIELVGQVSDPGLYAAAKEFHAAIVEGKVEVAPPPTGSDDMPGADPEKF